MVDMKMGAPPTFFPPYTTSTATTTSSAATAASNATTGAATNNNNAPTNAVNVSNTAAAAPVADEVVDFHPSDMARYLIAGALTSASSATSGNDAAADLLSAAAAAAYWPDYAYYLGGAAASDTTTLSGGAGSVTVSPAVSTAHPLLLSQQHQMLVSAAAAAASQHSANTTHTSNNAASTPIRSSAGGLRSSHGGLQHSQQQQQQPLAPQAPGSSRTLRTNRSGGGRGGASNNGGAASNAAMLGSGDVVMTSSTGGGVSSGGGNSSNTNARGAQFTIIANVPYDTVRQDLVSEFRKFGRVELAMVVCDEASRHPHKEWTSTAGYAFVRFSKRSEAAAAIQAATMGLITIRGTRVRADWARKDSYAKRGRVSPAQGAPALNPLGVPDGITLLQDSLNRAAAARNNQWSMYGDAVSGGTTGTTIATHHHLNMNINHTLHLNTTDTDDNDSLWPPNNKTTDIDASNKSSSSAGAPSNAAANEQVFQVLEDVIVQALELIGPQSTTTSTKYNHKPSQQSTNNDTRPLTLPICDSSSYCHRYPHHVGVERVSNLEGGTPQTAGDEETTASSTGVVPVAITQELASALSPASRGLLTVALSDVAARDAFTDVSPMAHQPPATHHAHHHFNSPEELLHHTMQNIAGVDVSPPPTSAATTRKSGGVPIGALGASTASDFSSLSEIEDIACSEGSLTPPLL